MERQTMVVRDKTYCEIQPAVWQRCDTAPHLASTAPGGGAVAVAVVMSVVMGWTAVDYRRRQLQEEIDSLRELIG